MGKITHNKSNTSIFHTWCNMRHRCKNQNRPDYKYYGGRGVRVCDEWDCSFENFYSWAINNGYKEGLTIDRIDVDGNYEPSNCRWVTRYTQMNNTRQNCYITIDGETKTAAEWGRISGIDGRLISERYRKGYDPWKCVFYKTLKPDGHRGKHTIYVVNMIDKTLFSSMMAASEYYHLASGSVSTSCKHPGGKWKKYEDYKQIRNLTDEEARKELLFIL